MLPRTNKRERNKKGVIYMCWTHVWMRDGILPLNRERLETTSTVKARVSQVGQAAFLLSSEKLPMPYPPANATCIAFHTEGGLIVLCCLITLGTVQKGLCQAAMFPLQAENAKCPAWSLMVSALRTSLQPSSVCWEQSWGHWGGQGAQAVPSDTTAPRDRLIAQQKEGQWGEDRLLRGCLALSSSSWVPHVCRAMCQPALSHLVWLLTATDAKCQEQCALGHLTESMPRLLCQWARVLMAACLQCLGTGPAGQFGDRSIMETPSTVGSLIFHNKPNILPPNPATLHHESCARDIVSGIISGGTGVRYGGKKARVRRDMVACLAPVSTALCHSCWSCSTLCSGL